MLDYHQLPVHFRYHIYTSVYKYQSVGPSLSIGKMIKNAPAPAPAPTRAPAQQLFATEIVFFLSR